MSLKIEDNIDNDLHTRMKNGSVCVHALAESTSFVKQFITCKISRKIYRVFLAQLYYIYKALECQAEQNCEDEVFQAIYFPTELDRKSSIEEDLEYFYGSNWQDNIYMLDATRNYVDRINEVGLDEPALLVSHCYTRYLGDISGGQILKYKLKKAFSLDSENEKGVKFYIFSEISDIKKFKTLYRNRLNSLEADPETCDKIEKEVITAFQYNIELFNELDKVAIETDGYIS